MKDLDQKRIKEIVDYSNHLHQIATEKAKETHDKLRNILIKYGNPEYGDCIVDEISWLFNFPTTIDVESEENE